MEKKWATGQRFIRKEITTYRIGTLISNPLFLVLPVPLTIAWLIAKSYEAETDPNYCGASSYINLKSYWILEGPRFAAFILNILILLSVIRVLVTHLSCNEILDTNQIK